MKLFGNKKPENKKQESLISTQVAKLEKGMLSLPDVVAPSSVEVDFQFIRVGERYFKTLFVVGYPRYVSPNWLQPLIDFEQSMNSGEKADAKVIF